HSLHRATVILNSKPSAPPMPAPMTAPRATCLPSATSMARASAAGVRNWHSARGTPQSRNSGDRYVTAVNSGANGARSTTWTGPPRARCRRTTLALSSGCCATNWPAASVRASNSMECLRIGTSRWAGKLTHGDRNGCLPLTVQGDVETIQPRVRKRNVEYEDRPGLDFGHARRRLGEVDVAVASQDPDIL